MITRHFFAYFEDSTAKTGKTGLTDVTFYVKSIKHSDSALAVVTNGVVGFEVGYGVYGIQVASLDFATYDYIGYAVTASTAVTSKAVPAMRWDAAESHTTELAQLDAAVSSRSTLTEAQVWAYATRTLTQSAASVAAAISGSALAVTHGVTYAATITGLTIPATWVKMFFTSKKDIDNDPDTASVIQIVESATPAASDGILYLGGSTVSTTVRDYGALTVNQGAGTVGIGLDDSLDLSNLGGLSSYDLKCLLADGTTVLVSNAASLSIGFTPTRSVA